ncbi:Crp family regulatory protein [Streptococcus porcinus]|uniref:cyclic nucleotide-binding domain-containing protein n=1 Tax=Streptococcus porcinus TaxID=1340 RepID=UPI0010CAC978|nr:cyclic nucleotide-binding domain-containing protein [Streptococcus porcinus]VTS17740.1 Crp family regulatory protein [Streptococcus porcinus]
MKTITNEKLLKELLKKYHLEKFFPKVFWPELQLVLFHKNDMICQQDQALTFIGYALAGNIKIVRRLSNGKEHILETHAKPCLIGDIELLTNQNAVTSVIALEETYLIQLKHINKKKLLANPEFLYQISQELAKNFYKQNIKSTQNLSYTVKERLAKHILENEENGYFQLDLTLLADSFGTSYRHLHRVIAQLLEVKIIEKVSFKYYHILSKETLEDLADLD